MKPRKLLLLASLAFAMPFAQYSLALEVRDESIVISGQLTDAVVDEGARTASFAVWLSRPSGTPVSVSYATADDSAFVLVSSARLLTPRY